MLDDAPKYAMYLRKSRADLELEAISKEETLARHKTRLMELAEKLQISQEQITIYHEIVSGESIQARPEMQRLLNDVYQRKYAGVLVVEIERLARGNTKDQGEVADAFQYSNTLIITPTKTYDPNNEFDQEYFEFGLFMSRREYKTIRRRMEAGKLQSIKEGNYIGNSKIYGYDKKMINKKQRTLVIIPEEAAVVRMIFDLFTHDNISAGRIAKKLTEMHIPTPSGGAEWSRGSVTDILKNIHYTGKIRWHYKITEKVYNPKTGKVEKKIKKRREEDCDVYQGQHEPIISEEQFRLAQSLFVRRTPTKMEHELINPLAGLLYCKACGHAVVYRKFKTALPRYIHCQSFTCDKMKSCSVNAVLDALKDSLLQIIDDYQMIVSNRPSEAAESTNKAIIEALEAELAKQEKRRKRLFDAFEDGVYSNEEFVERKRAVNEAIDEIRKQIATERDNLPEVIDYEAKIVSLHQIIDTLNDDSVSAEDKNNLLKTVISRIDLSVTDLGLNHGAVPALDVFLM